MSEGSETGSPSGGGDATTQTLYTELRDTLRSLFELDKADLDFGIYRVMAARNEKVNAFLDFQLREVVNRALGKSAGQPRTELEEELKAARSAAREHGLDPDASPKVRALAAKLQAGDGVEAEVYRHLRGFFGRYYDRGDFVSQRRHRGSDGMPYAIPYDGREVVLHWANKDQHYIKSGTAHRDYAFTLPGGPPGGVRLKVVAGEDTTGNNKKDRAYAPADPFVLLTDAGGEPVEKPSEAAGLTLRFEHRPPRAEELAAGDAAEGLPVTAASNDDRRLLDLAYDRALAEAPPAFAGPLTEVVAEGPRRTTTEKEGKRDTLTKHLQAFVAKNEQDYFIHKDLRGFLSGELDRYLKDEVLDLDNLMARDDDHLARRQGVMVAIRKVAQATIDFLAGIEEFQKKLWLKKKLVKRRRFLVSAARVATGLRPAVVACGAQWEAWEADGYRDAGAEAAWGTAAYLDAYPGLVVDSAVVEASSPGWTGELLGSFEDLDAATTGTLVHGENFNALNLLQARYAGEVKCCYIDPPYNTGKDGFAYKDRYQSSSWMSMIHDRVSLGRKILAPEGVHWFSIDTREHGNLLTLCDAIFENDNFIGELIWRNARDNNPTQIATEHEFVPCFAKNRALCPEVWKSEASIAKSLLQDEYERLREAGGTDGEIQANLRSFIADNVDQLAEVDRYKFVDSGGVYTGSQSVHNPHPNGYVYDVIHPETGVTVHGFTPPVMAAASAA